jgi:hypothetical protein
VLLEEPRQLLPQLPFFVFGHRHRFEAPTRPACQTSGRGMRPKLSRFARAYSRQAGRPPAAPQSSEIPGGKSTGGLLHCTIRSGIEIGEL